jgi:hypothetical protein
MIFVRVLVLFCEFGPVSRARAEPLIFYFFFSGGCASTQRSNIHIRENHQPSRGDQLHLPAQSNRAHHTLILCSCMATKTFYYERWAAERESSAACSPTSC